MKLENKVISLETAIKLHELKFEADSEHHWVLIQYGIPKNSKCAWSVEPRNKSMIRIPEHFLRDSYPAYDVAELGEILPSCYSQLFVSLKRMHYWGCMYQGATEEWSIKEIQSKTEAEARGKILIILLNKDFVKGKKDENSG